MTFQGIDIVLMDSIGSIRLVPVNDAHDLARSWAAAGIPPEEFIVRMPDPFLDEEADFMARAVRIWNDHQTLRGVSACPRCQP